MDVRVYGQKGLATLADVSADYDLNPHVAVGVYYAHAAGKLVMQSIYPKDKNGNFGYIEFTWKF